MGIRPNWFGQFDTGRKAFLDRHAVLHADTGGNSRLTSPSGSWWRVESAEQRRSDSANAGDGPSAVVSTRNIQAGDPGLAGVSSGGSMGRCYHQRRATLPRTVRT